MIKVRQTRIIGTDTLLTVAERLVEQNIISPQQYAEMKERNEALNKGVRSDMIVVGEPNDRASQEV